MSDLSPTEIGVAFVQAFGRGDMAALAAQVADDIVFTSPRTRITGAEPYLAAVGEFARIVSGVDIIAAYGDDDGVMVMYDMVTGPFGVVRAVDHLVLPDGRIQVHNLVFDTYEVRRVAGDTGTA